MRTVVAGLQPINAAKTGKGTPLPASWCSPCAVDRGNGIRLSPASSRLPGLLPATDRLGGVRVVCTRFEIVPGSVVVLRSKGVMGVFATGEVVRPERQYGVGAGVKRYAPAFSRFRLALSNGNLARRKIHLLPFEETNFAVPHAGPTRWTCAPPHAVRAQQRDSGFRARQQLTFRSTPI